MMMMMMMMMVGRPRLFCELLLASQARLLFWERYSGSDNITTDLDSHMVSVVFQASRFKNQPVAPEVSSKILFIG